jgi:hypothetical protein
MEEMRFYLNSGRTSAVNTRGWGSVETPQGYRSPQGIKMEV